MNTDTDSTSKNAGRVLSLSLSKKRRLSAVMDPHSSGSPSPERPDTPNTDLVRTMSKARITEASDDEDMDSMADSDFWDKVCAAEAQLTKANDSESLPVSATPEENIIEEDASLDTPIVSTAPVSAPPVSTPTVSTPPTNTAPAVKRKMVGEDVFTESCVKDWQGSRIKAWEGRYMNPEGYYFRFVTPGEGQQNGGWSKKENELFMQRYNEWRSKGWKIGASWGLFSQGIPHRVGYQCMNYYRKLISDKKLQDDSYAVVDGKLKQVHKDRAPAGEIPTTVLGSEWQTEEVKRIEEQVNGWLKKYHNRSGSASVRASSALSTLTKKTPRVPKSTTVKKSISDLVKKQPLKKRLPFVLDDDQGNDNDSDFLEDEPERVHMKPRAHDWQVEWYSRLENYMAFMRPFLHPTAYNTYWHAKQEWRRGLATTEMLLRKPLRIAPASETNDAPKPANQRVQVSLSRFFTGVKKLKVDTPDELISNVRIPNELFSGVHQITPLAVSKRQMLDQSKIHYHELDNMKDCIGVLDALLEGQSTEQSRLEGVLVDPPWEFYVQDGRNDGRCNWNLMDVARLLEKVLAHMSAGLVFIWTHKLIQADVFRMMDALDCKYVENLVWFKKSINNVPLDRPSPYISSAKEILLMFKKGEGFELRHQRTADVIIDFEKPTEQWIHQEFTEPKPPGVYDMIETLLPRAGYSEELQRGRLLELWAKKASPRREGWISFHQIKSPIIPATQDQTALSVE